MKISIELTTLNGQQIFEGEELTNEVAVELINLAKQMIPASNMFETKTGVVGLHTFEPQPIIHSDLDLTIGQVAAPLQCCNHETKQTPIVESNKAESTQSTTTHSTDEKVDPYAEDNANYFETGIKYRHYNGEKTPSYRCRWNCPKCNSSGNHYIFENSKRVFCYECNAPLNVENVGKKVTDRDEHGNYFVANTLDTKFQRA